MSTAAAPVLTQAEFEAANASAIAWLTSLGAHQMPLREMEKRPVSAGWPVNPAVTPESAEGWVAQFGNLGVNVGRSQLVILDAEDALATAWVQETLGFTPTVITANAQNPANVEKFGGRHFYLPLPEGVAGEPMHYRRTTVLPNGGKLEVLAGHGRFAVAPPTCTAESGYRRYTVVPTETGELPLLEWLRARQTAPSWLWDRATALPAGVPVELHGCVAPRPERPKRKLGVDDRNDRQRAMDEQPISEILDLRFSEGEADGCGCPAYHFAGATNPKSVTLHEGCAFGHTVRLWSGTCAEQLGLDADCSYDRLRFAAAVRGVDQDELAQEWGLPARPDGLQALNPDDLEAYADDIDSWAEAGETEMPIPGPHGATDWAVVDMAAWAAAHRRGAAAIRADREAAAARVQQLGQAGGESFAQLPVVGSVATATVFPAAADTVGAAEEAAEVSEADEDEDLRLVRNLRAEVEVLERKLATMTPGLGRIADLAEAEGIYMSGLLVALGPLVLSSVPPNVLLPPTNGVLHKSKGVSTNVFAIPVAPTSAGKGVTNGAAYAAVPPHPDLVDVVPEGTAEGTIKAGRVGRGKSATVMATSLLVHSDEIDVITAEFVRLGSKYRGFIRKSWMGEMVGQIASDDKRKSELPPHSTRIGMLVYAQPYAIGPIQEDASGGTRARFMRGLVGLVDEEDHGPLYGTTVAPVLANQDRLPWRAPTGIPQAFMPEMLIRNESVPADSEEAKASAIPVWDNCPPWWVGISSGVRAAIRAELQRASRRSKDWLLAEAEDAEGISGHVVLQREKWAFFIGLLDGDWAISDAYWEAAGVMMEIDRLVDRAAAVMVARHEKNDRAHKGTLDGVGRAAAKAAEGEEGVQKMRETMDRILAVLRDAKGNQLTIGKFNAKLSKPQRPYRMTALRELTGTTGGVPRIRIDGAVVTLIG